METDGVSPEGERSPREPKNIVVLCDGTGNEVAGDLSNVLKLFRIVKKGAKQRVYYHPGVGTVGEEREWAPKLQKAKAIFGLATGWGLDDNILEAYRFIANVYEDGDRIFLFGFSRGAYTVRCLAGFIHMIGLLRPDQINIADYALTTYKRSGRGHERKQVAAVRQEVARQGQESPAVAEGPEAAQRDEDEPFEVAWDFARTTGARRATIHFMGVWDTVASMIVPRPDRLGFQLRSLPYTRRNPSVRAFRHAMAIDERRRMFRLNRWDENQAFVVNPFSRPKKIEPQDCRQIWFAGVHSDIGGGYAEKDSSLSKLPLIWMVEEATRLEHGLMINTGMFNHLARGIPREGWTHRYVKPDPCGPMHVSLKGFGWKFMEYLPKSTFYREWRTGTLGFYFPLGEPRPVPPAEELHWSVDERRAGCPGSPPVPPGERVPGCLYPPYEPENLRKRQDLLPPDGPGAAAGRALIGIPVLLFIAALSALLIWKSFDRAGSFLWGLLVAIALTAGLALLALALTSAFGLLRNALGRKDE